MAKEWSIFYMKKSGIPHSEEEKAGDGEVYKTEMVGKVHAELIFAKPHSARNKRCV